MHNTIATFAEETTIVAVGKSHEEDIKKLQKSINQITPGRKDSELN